MEVLANGARLLLVPTGAPTTGREPVSAELWVMGGTSAERPDEPGCAHLLEHMLFKPGSEGTADDLASQIEGLGGDVNAFTSHDETVFYATLPAGVLESGLDALVRPVLHPVFDPVELREEAQVVVEEIRQYRDDPAQRVMQDAISRLFPEHSYGRPVLGNERAVLSHRVRRLRRFHRRVYAGRQLFLVVVGPMDRGRVARRARRLLRSVAAGHNVPRESRPTPVRGTVRVKTADVVDAQILLAWQGPPPLEPEGLAVEAASVVLGHGDASRLVREVRRNAGLVSDVQAHWYASREASTLVVRAHTQPQQVADALDEIVGHVRRLGRDPVDGLELARARAVLESDRVYGQETVSGRAHVLGYLTSLCGDPNGESIYYRHLRGLDRETIRRVWAQIVEPSAASVGVLLPRDVPPKLVKDVRARARKSVARSPAPRSRRKKGARPGSIRLDTEAGLRIRVVIDRGVPMTAGWLVWPGGQREERPTYAGSSTLMARLLTRGTARRSGDDLAQEIDGQAAVLGGFVGRNSLGLHFECLAPDFSVIVGRALECATVPTFPAHELEEERRVLLQEIEAEADDLGRVALREMSRALYGRHPLGRPPWGTPETLARTTPTRLKNAFLRDCPLGSAVLGLCGDVDLEGLEAVLRSVDVRPPRRPPAPPKAPTWRTRPHQVFVERDREQCHVAMGHPGLALSDPDLLAVELLLAILGGQAGRLFQALREREGLVYEVSASSVEAVDGGHVAVYAATSVAKLERTLGAMERELARARETLPKAEELERARAWLTGQFEVSLQRRSRVASLLAFDEVYGLGADHYRTYVARAERVTARDVRAAARRVLDPGSRVIAIVGPPS